MVDREKLIDIIVRTPCVAVSSRIAAEHIADHLISCGMVVREKGEWERVVTDYGCKYACSRCHKKITVDCYEDETSEEPPDFCAHCGVDMRKGKNDG